MNLFDLKGKTAIVTGGNRGLGKGITEGLAMAGAKVVIMASSDKVFDVAEEFCKKGYAVSAVQHDLSKIEQTESAFNKALNMLGGKLDIIVNNAGVQRRNKSEIFTMEDWKTVTQINLDSVFTLCQLAGQHMLQNGGGKIINIASLLSFFGGYTVPAYAAAKGGVAQLTKALSNEWASRGININAIAPGYMATEMNTALIEDEGRSKEILSRIPAGRWGKPADIMGTAIFLASDASDYLNGAIIPVDGGYLGR